MIMPTSAETLAAARREFYAGLEARQMAPLWEVLKGLVTPEPRTAMRPAIWRYDEVRPWIFRAGEMITAAEAERRVLILENPAAPGQSRITNTLYAGLQLLLPGEVAPCHRHTQSALRFVFEGEGAFTALDGRRAMMRRWDLVLTPNWVWHDHGNESTSPMVWLDGLDIPLVAALDASFAEHRAEVHPPANETVGPGGAPPWRGRYQSDCAGRAAPDLDAAALIYPYSEWRNALRQLTLGGEPEAEEGYRLEFLDPRTGGPVMQTVSAFAQLVPSGLETRARQTTDAAVYVVVEGEGHAWIGAEEAFQLREGDIFVVPSWAERRFAASSDLVLFSYSDRATQQKLGLWRAR